MNLKRWLGDRDKAIAASNKMAMSLMLSVVLIGFLLFAASQNHTRFIIAPPYLDERIELAYSAANEAFHRKYGLYAGVLLGNVTPESADVVLDALSQMMDPSLYQRMHEDVSHQVDQLKKTGTNIRFYPALMEYEPATGKTFVTGTQDIIPTNGPTKSAKVSFEFVFKIDNYLPQIVQFDFYQDSPRTLKYLEKMKRSGRNAKNQPQPAAAPAPAQ